MKRVGKIIGLKYVKYLIRVDSWLHRTHSHAPPKPDWVLQKKEYGDFDPQALREDTWKYKVPAGWDPNLLYTRFFYASVKNGKVVIGRYMEGAKCRLQFKFSSAVKQMLGYSMIMEDVVQWESFPVDHDIIRSHSHHGGDQSGWATSKREQEYHADYFPDMDAITIHTIWIMCDCIEDIDIGDRLHRPILRSLPMTHVTQQHSSAAFGNLQFRKIIKRNVDCITIRMYEDLKGSILDIQGDVFLMLEIQKNAR